MSPKADWDLMNTLRRESQKCVCYPCELESCKTFCDYHKTNHLLKERQLRDNVQSTSYSSSQEDKLALWPCPRRDRKSHVRSWAPGPPSYGENVTTFWWPPAVNQNTIRNWDLSREGGVHHENVLAQNRIMSKQFMQLGRSAGYHNRPGQGFHFC